VDECSDVGGYSIVWDEQSDTMPDDVKDMEGDATTATSPALPDGVGSWFHIRGVDDLGNWSDEAAHIGPFPIDVECPSEISDIASSTHTIGECNSIRMVKVSWIPAQDSGSGLGG